MDSIAEQMRKRMEDSQKGSTGSGIQIGGALSGRQLSDADIKRMKETGQAMASGIGAVKNRMTTAGKHKALKAKLKKAKQTEKERKEIGLMEDELRDMKRKEKQITPPNGETYLDKLLSGR